MKEALIVVDIQNDFLPGGALPVPDGDQVIPVANRAMKLFQIVAATQDWHPADHGSFASRHPGRHVGDVVDLNGIEQILWPDHCVQNTRGSEFAPGLEAEGFQAVFHKGVEAGIDSYSALFDNAHRRATGLGDWLKERRVGRIWLVGLATDYCVKFTALDARDLGLGVRVILEGVRGVELNEGDCDKALEEMRDAGAEIIGEQDLG